MFPPTTVPHAISGKGIKPQLQFTTCTCYSLHVHVQCYVNYHGLLLKTLSLSWLVCPGSCLTGFDSVVYQVSCLAGFDSVVYQVSCLAGFDSVVYQVRCLAGFDSVVYQVSCLAGFDSASGSGYLRLWWSRVSIPSKADLVLLFLRHVLPALPYIFSRTCNMVHTHVN